MHANCSVLGVNDPGKQSRHAVYATSSAKRPYSFAFEQQHTHRGCLAQRMEQGGTKKKIKALTNRSAALTCLLARSVLPLTGGTLQCITKQGTTSE